MLFFAYAPEHDMRSLTRWSNARRLPPVDWTLFGPALLRDADVVFPAFDPITGGGSASVRTASGKRAQVYFVDTSTTYGGLWRVPSLGGAPTRMVADPDASAEPSVRSVGGHDQVIFSGTAASSNAGGLDYLDTADNSRHTLLSSATLAAFLETNVADISIASTGTDADGNVYFNNTDSSPERRGIYKLDAQGRLIKVVSFAERKAVTGATNSNTLRLQPRTTTFTGPNGAYELTQVLYTESSPLNQVAGAYVFKPGDFNRDNVVDVSDFDLLEAVLTRGGVAVPTDKPENLKFDVNGNGSVDFKDVKVLQSFVGFADGDTDFSFTVDFADLLTLAKNYNKTGTTWTSGDFDGDETTAFSDLLALAKKYNSSVSPALGADAAGFYASFASDWALATSLVPEPTLALGIAAGLLLLGEQGRRPRTANSREASGR